MSKKLVLENGMEFFGLGLNNNDCIGVLKYITNMVGYQEVLTDPFFRNTILVMGYPLIGNYGMTDDDYESKNIQPAGIVCYNINKNPSNYRYTKTLEETVEDISVITKIDTRLISKLIINNDLVGMICDSEKSIEDALREIKNYKKESLLNLVSTKKIWYSKTKNPLLKIAIIDCGVKKSLIKNLNLLLCNLIIVPHNITKEELDKLNCDAIIVSNGPGTIEDASALINLIKACNNYQILGISYGASICFKALDGKLNKRVNCYSSNHPCKNIVTGKIKIVSLNNNYCLTHHSSLKITAIDLSTKEIIEMKNNNFTLVQYDADLEILDEFINTVKCQINFN